MAGSVDFDENIAPALAAEFGFTASSVKGKRSSHFTYFEDDDRLLMVAGEHSGKSASLALAYGLTWRESRQLELLLPENRAFATRQRAAWLSAEVAPRVHLHDGKQVTATDVDVSTEIAIAALQDRIPKGNTPAADLRAASEALHLGGPCSDALDALTEWATEHPALDPAHRQSYRAWHHMGMSVLEITGSGRKAVVRAGINDKDQAIGAKTFTASPAAPLAGADLEECQAWVEKGIAARANGPFCKPDEHWLQAVLRADPRLAGVEQPALREVPAWRPPSDPNAKLDRGYVDIVGLDGSGDIRVVETKLAANDDSMLIFQGLDYYAWAQVYAQALRERLGASDKARLKLCYLIGSAPDSTIKVSSYAQAQVDAIAPGIEALYLGITDWFTPAHPSKAPHVTALDSAILST